MILQDDETNMFIQRISSLLSLAYIKWKMELLRSFQKFFDINSDRSIADIRDAAKFTLQNMEIL